MVIQENPQYEAIISDLLEQQYSIIEDFFDLSEVEELRTSLLQKYEEDNFKKAAIGNRTNEVIAKSIRGDFIMWLNEAEGNLAEKTFFRKINDFAEKIKAQLPSQLKLFSLRLQETETSYAEWFASDNP